jgi:hypothetical protein
LLLWRAFGLAPAVPRAERRSPAHFSLAGALARVLARSRSEALVRAGLLLVLTCALSRLAALQQPAHLRAIACTGAWWWCALALGPLCAALEEAHTRERWSLLFAPAGAFVRAKLSLLLPAAALGGLLSGAAAGLTLAPFGGLAGLCAGGAVAASERDLERRGAAPGARVTRRVLLLLAGTLLAWSFE